ncbi:AAA family ATPase [Rhizobium leguminosarum]|uniref:AAA family ATPase n=1 Tax=Rhizobium leguminosarum TaxID=384 RepID=UPI001F464B4F|nr:AAA family ATPase [Rhizobium leguminosarum]UIK19379.1 ATP-binding protein [Rhizobium leguminosarum]
MTSRFAITTVDVDLPRIGRQTLSFSKRSVEENQTTILVGRNGTGKSSILRELAMSFRAYFSKRELKSRQGMGWVSHIGISCDGYDATLNVTADRKVFRREREDLQALRPTRVIALSFTPFDKFPPADDIRDNMPGDSRDPFYIYLGFKADVRMSPRSRLLRSIDQLAFSERTPFGDQRVVETLNAIGYGPVVTITYELSPKVPPADLESRSSELVDFLTGYQGERAPKSDRHSFSLVIDFSTGETIPEVPIELDELRTFLRQGIVKVSSIVLRRRDFSDTVELLELSSGELNLLSGFLGLASFLEDGCVVLIDEPENSLHPEWQLSYVEMLDAVVRQHSGCHYVIATHSPLIVSGVANEATKVLRLDQEPVELAPAVLADSSPDATLLNAFKVVTAGNNFLKQLVLEALTFIETGKHKEHRAQELAGFLASIWGSIPETDPLRDLVSEVVVAIQPQ